MKKSSSGFTLFELIAALASAAMVLVMALSFLLLGMRLENRSSDKAAQQHTARVVLTMAEKLAINGDINEIQYAGESWVLCGDNGQYLLRYLATDGALMLGDSILIHDLKSAHATLSNDDKLFTLAFETLEDEYATTVYCRNTGAASAEAAQPALLRTVNFGTDTSDGRLAFLNELSSQRGSHGEIIGHVKTADEPWEYFSEWYIHQQNADYENTDWNSDTPWCACFISWAASRINSADYLQAAPYFADVDNGVEYFKSIAQWHEKTANSTPVPEPGDLVFFDWDRDSDPDHVGAVLRICVEDGSAVIYAIEGNSGNEVRVNRYPISSDDIIGYGVLKWK